MEFLTKAIKESQTMPFGNTSPLPEDEKFFQALWESYLNYETLHGRFSLAPRKGKATVEKISLFWHKASSAFSLKEALLPLSLAPVPQLRSRQVGPLYHKAEWELSLPYMPHTPLKLIIEAHLSGLELAITCEKKLPAWLIFKLYQGEKFVELQNFREGVCRFYWEAPQGRWVLWAADSRGKKSDSCLLELSLEKR